MRISFCESELTKNLPFINCKPMALMGFQQKIIFECPALSLETTGKIFLYESKLAKNLWFFNLEQMALMIVEGKRF